MAKNGFWPLKYSSRCMCVDTECTHYKESFHLFYSKGVYFQNPEITILRERAFFLRGLVFMVQNYSKKHGKILRGLFLAKNRHFGTFLPKITKNRQNPHFSSKKRQIFTKKRQNSSFRQKIKKSHFFCQKSPFWPFLGEKSPNLHYCHQNGQIWFCWLQIH